MARDKSKVLSGDGVFTSQEILFLLQHLGITITMDEEVPVPTIQSKEEVFQTRLRSLDPQSLMAILAENAQFEGTPTPTLPLDVHAAVLPVASQGRPTTLDSPSGSSSVVEYVSVPLEPVVVIDPIPCSTKRKRPASSKPAAKRPASSNDEYTDIIVEPSAGTVRCSTRPQPAETPVPVVPSKAGEASSDESDSDEEVADLADSTTYAGRKGMQCVKNLRKKHGFDQQFL